VIVSIEKEYSGKDRATIDHMYQRGDPRRETHNEVVLSCKSCNEKRGKIPRDVRNTSFYQLYVDRYFGNDGHY
jgi:hypothetical protein